VHQSGRVTGFGGVIPACYALHGEKLPVLLATTWRVAQAQVAASTAVFLKMRRASRTVPVVHTTPSPKIQKVLLKMGAMAQTHVTRRVYLAGGLRHLRPGRLWPRLDSSSTLITDPAAVRIVARPWQSDGRLEKWISPESLRWAAATPMHRLHFLGAMDAAGVLTSFLMLVPRALRGLPAWDVVESFTTATLRRNCTHWLAR